MSYSDILKKHGLVPEEEKAKRTFDSVNTLNDILDKHGVGSGGRTITVDDVNNWYKSVSKYANNASNYLNADGYKAPNADLLKEMDGYLSKANDIYQYIRTNKEGFSNFDEVVQNHYDTVSYLRNLKTALQRSNNFYSDFKDEEDYNFWDQHSTVEKRQAWHQDQQAKVDDLTDFYNNYYTIDLWYQDYKERPWEYTEEEAAEKLAQYKKHLDYKQKYGSIDEVKSEIEAAEAEILNYKRGNYNENGRFYGSKVVDDNYDVTQAADFAITSANRNYKNPSREEIELADVMNDNSTWKWDDANGVYRDAFGNELAVDENNTYYNPAAQKTQVTDKLGLYLNTSEDDRIDAALGDGMREGIWTSVMREGFGGSWTYLDDTELGIYYTYLGESQEKAYQYLEDMKPELNRRQTLDEMGQWDKSYGEANLLEKIAMNAATVPSQLLSSIAGTVDNAVNTVQGNDINPYSYAHSGMHYSQTVRGAAAEELSDNKFLGDFFTVGDLYQSGMSMVDSLVAMGVGGNAGGVLLSMGAAQNEAYRLYQQGASNDQIAFGAAAAGAAEMIFESISIGELDKIKNMASPKTLAQFFKTLLIQGGVEASEEFLTEIANTVSNAFIMGSQSDWAALMEDNDGKLLGALKDKTLDALHAGLGGFFSGAGSGSIVGGSSYLEQLDKFRQAGKKIKAANGGVDALKTLADEVAGVSEEKMQKSLTKQAGKVGEKSFATKVGRLYDTVQTANKVANTSANQADIAKSLERKGFSKGTANDIAAALVASYNGQTLTKAQSRLLESAKDNKVVQEAISNIIDNDQSTMGQRQQNIRDFHEDVKAGTISKAFGISKDAAKKLIDGITKGNIDATTETAYEGNYEVSTDGKAVLDGKEVKLAGLQETDGGTVMVATADGQTADGGEVIYPSNGHALVYEGYLNIAETAKNPVVASMNVAARSALAKAYDLTPGVNGKVYFMGANQAFWYGFEGISMDDNALPVNSPIRNLSDEQRAIAYEEGRKAGKKAAKTQETAIKAAHDSAVEKLGGKKAAVNAAKKNAGMVVLDDGIREATMTKKQRASYQMADIVAKAVGNTIHVYHGMQEYGKYDPATGEIWLNINGNFSGSSMMAFALSHELVHMAKQWSPADYKAFADYLVKQYGKKGVSVEALVLAQMQNARNNGYELDEHEAYEEVIADACSRMLLDSDALQKMAGYREQNPDKWQKIVDAIRKFINKVRKAFKGADPDAYEAELFKQFDDAVKNELEKKFVTMVMNASEHMSTIHNAFGKDTVVEVNADGEFTLAKGEVGGTTKFLYNDSTWERGGRDTLKAALKAEGFSQEDIDAALTIMDGKHKLVKKLAKKFPEQARINKATITTDLKDGHSVLSALVSNGDYPVNIDLLMVCKKRKAYQRVIDRLCETGMIQQATVDALAIAEINKILGKYGFETACLGCFVESRRLRIQEWAETIVKEWNSEVKKRNPNAKAFGFGKGEATLTPDEVMQLVGELEGHEKNDKGNLNLGQGSAVKRMGVLLDKVPSLRKTLSVEDLITPDGLSSLRRYDSNLFSMVKSRYGSNSPKFVQEFNPYNHELAMYGKVPTEYNSLREYLYAIGGARMQSFSDFIVENWFDYCQIVADLAARKLPMHTYTKEISLAKLFGLTGIKINMSLIPDIDRSLGKEFAGLTRNANGELELIWADKDRYKATGGKSYMQSINFADAIALQNDPRYSANVGTIAVGVSDKHILMMLDDSRIRMIIPYHSSGMNPIFADLMGTSYYKDYTMFQNTTVKQLYNSKGQKVSLKLDKTQTGKLTSGFQFNEVLQELGDARAAAQAYKDWCADASKHTITIKGETYTAELTPKFDDFSGHENYYKLLEDFNTYDCISEEAAQQGDVQQVYPEDFDEILKAELKAQDTHRQKQEESQAFDKAMGEIESYLSTHTKADTVFYAEQHGVKLSAKDKKLGAEDKRKLADLRKGMKMSMPKVDSEGRQLTAEQLEFFRDSFVRDTEGKLLVVYHGTPNGSTTIFDKAKTSEINDMGQGIYFSTNKVDASSYMGKSRNKKLYSTYVNIKAPFVVSDNVKITVSEAASLLKLCDDRSLALDVYRGDVLTNAKDGYITTSQLANTNISQQMTKILEKSGKYDGIIDETVSVKFGLEEGTKHIIALNSNQIKLVDNQKPTTNPDIRYSMPKVPAPTFYSQMARVVDGVKQEKLGAASVVSTLRNKGVKAEEIKWSGIEAWLEGKKSVTKAELQEFIAGSMLQIEEEILDNKDRPYTEDQQKRLDEYEAKRDEVAKRLASEWKKITGEEFTIQNAAGLESLVTQAILEANSKKKKATFEGRLLAKLKSDLKEVIENNDDFGFDSWMDAMRSIHRHRRDFITRYEMSTNEKAIIVKYCNALNAYNELPNMISDADTDRLRAIAREAAPWNRKIMEVKHEYNEEAAKYRPNWKEYSLKGGKNYREMLFRIPGSTYSNAAMFGHWKDRSGVLAHARVQDMDTFIGKMLFIEEIQSDWHNAGQKNGYDSDADNVAATEKLRELKNQKEKLFEEMDANSKAYDAFLTEYWETDMSDAEYTSRAEKQQRERLEFLYKERELNRQINEIEKDIEAATPDAPFKDTYHEYVLKRLLREAAEQDYDSIGWTTAETQDERWQNNLPHKEGTGKSGFLVAYRNVYDRRMKKFLSDFGKKWGTSVGKTVLDNGTEVWSMAITDSMKDSVLYEGQPKYSMPKVNNPYSYDTLISKPDMVVATVGGNIPNNRADLVRMAKQNAAMVGKIDPKSGSVSVYVKDIGRYVGIGRDGLKHSLDGGRISVNAPVLVKAGEIISNSIRINELTPREDNIDESYVLIGAARNANNDLYIVRSVVNRFSYKLVSLDVLYAINAKKEPAALLPLSAGNPALGTDSTISIAKLLDYVNQYFSDILPEEVLKYYGHDSRPAGELGKDALYKTPNSRGMSPRQLLADAFDELVQTPKERELMDQYRKNIANVEGVQERLRKLRAEISKLTKAKGDKAKIAEMNKTATELAELIDKYDRKLLDLEASKPLKDVLARARSAAYQEAKQRSEESLKEYRQQVSDRFDRGVENRRKTEMRKKIRKVIRDLDKILNRGDKKRNVKEDMKDFVAEALASADVLFTDNYTNDDIVHNGFGVELSKEEAKYLEEARKFMDELANLPAGSYDAWQARQEAEETLKNKLAYRMSKLKDAFFRERQRLNKTEVAEVLGKLADAYAKLETSEYAYVNGAYHETVYEYLKMLQEDVGGTKIRDMTLGQLEELHKAYTMVLTTVQTANKMFAEDLKLSKEEMANRVMMEVYQAGGEHGLWSKGQLARNQASWNNTKPIYAAERTGSSTFVQLVKGLFKGQYNWAIDMEEAKAFRKKVAEKYGFKSWDMEKTYKFTSSSGIEFELNLNHIMSLYAYAKREQAHDHLLKGGFVFGKNTEVVVTKNGIKRTYLNKSAKAHNISDEIMGEIVSKLSAEQRGFVDEMQDYLSTTMGAKGNEVSMRLYGVKLFMEKFYFPLRSAGQFKEKAKEAELKQQQGQISIANSGFTHGTKPKASNPVVLDGFTDVWAGHVNEMSLYHSMVLPMEDFRRVYNYASPNMEGQESASVNSFIENAYGDAATGYFDQLYKELNGGAIVDPRENLAKQMIGKFKKASVMLSNSVVVQQFSAIGRAYALIDPKYFVGQKVDKKKHKVLWNEVKQYAPVAIIKEMGGFDTHTGLSAKDYLLAEEYGKGERVEGFFKDEQYRSEIMGMLPAKADEMTWCAIWEAVKRETKEKNPKMDVKSEEFLRKAGERFSEVIEKTQVYDSVLARSANMRSKQGLMQMLTAFLAEPTTTVNMVEDALRKGDKNTIARTFGAVAASIILNNALASIVYAMRDDDDDETFLEKYAQSVASGMLDDINPMTCYPILKDIWSLFQGYDVERTDMAIYSDIADSVKKVVVLIAKHDPETDDAAEFYREIASALMGLLDAGASAFGVPLRNVRRDLMSYYNTFKTFARGGGTTWNSFVDAVGGAAVDTIPVVGWVAGKSTPDKLYDAIISGDTVYVNRLKSGYKDADAYSNAVRKALRENDPRVKEAAQAQINGNPSERVRIARLIIADGFAQDDVVRAINAEINALTSDDSSSGTKKEKGFYTAEDFAKEIANGDQAAANAAKSDIIRTAQKNGKTEEEAEESFTSSAKTELKELFLAGKISEDKVVDALVSYCDMDEVEAELKVESYAWEDQGYEGVTSAAVRDYNTFCAESNVPKDVYLNIRAFSNNTENDKDASGKSIAYSAMKKVMAEIDAQPGLTSAQKTAIARSLGWAEKNIQKYKTW